MKVLNPELWLMYVIEYIIAVRLNVDITVANHF